MIGITPSFQETAKQAKRTPFAYAFEQLVKEIKTLTRTDSNIDHFEPEFRAAFRKFLTDLDMPLALKNFDALLAEKSGQKFYRADGTVNWYHEFLPLLEMMELAKRGHKYGGFDLKELDPYGGLEVLICTHLRHDSVEDFTSKEAMIKEQIGFIDEICRDNRAYDKSTANQMANQMVINVDLMSQQWVRQEDGTLKKEDVRIYTHRMVNSEHANPIVFMCKQADINHNFATLFGASKFTPERRAKRCDEREDMYGPRYGFAGKAMEKWKPFASAINALDSMMGFMLYPHFRYLESVDLFYKDSFDYSVGTERYNRRVVNVQLPEVVNLAHIFLKRINSSVSEQEYPEKFVRLQNFMENIIKPTLLPHKDKFPYLFQNSGMNNDLPQPTIAVPQIL